MPAPSFAEFREQSLAQGYDEVLERIWAADSVVESHTHPFALKALVVAGEMWLQVEGHTRHLVSGDQFSLGHEQAHAERYGPAGATYWVARRNPAED